MKVYVVETVADETVQCGMTLSKETAEQTAKWLNEHSSKNVYGQPMYDYFITEYELNDDYTQFDY